MTFRAILFGNIALYCLFNLLLSSVAIAKDSTASPQPCRSYDPAIEKYVKYLQENGQDPIAYVL